MTNESVESQPSVTPPDTRRWLVQVCQHRSCLRNQAQAVLATFQQYRSEHILVAESDCMGQCSAGPMVRILPDDTWYCQISPTDVPRIVEQHLGQGQPVRERLHTRFHPSPEA